MGTEGRYQEFVEMTTSEVACLVLGLEDKVKELEAYIEKREEYVEFLVKELGDVQFDLMMAENR